jgi:ATP-dependent Zn protease
MNPIRRSPLAAACAALVLLLLATAPATAATDIHFQHESYQEFLKQLEHREAHAVVLHVKQRVVHVTLADGRHLTAVYPASEQARIVEEARAKGASATVAVVKVKPVHHKLRYIAGGVLIVVILVVLVVLLIGRRRALEEGEAPQGGEASSVGPPAASG